MLSPIEITASVYARYSSLSVYSSFRLSKLTVSKKPLMFGRILWSGAPLQKVNYNHISSDIPYHPRLIQILQLHSRWTRILFTTHILSLRTTSNTYTNEILQSLVILPSRETSRSTNILLKEGNCRSMSDLVSLNNIKVVISFNLYLINSINHSL